jgi:hypothetical protein
MIVKQLLTEWKREANKDLRGVPYTQIADAVSESSQVIKNYMTLTNQKRFDPAIIEKINQYRLDYKEMAKALTNPVINPTISLDHL